MRKVYSLVLMAAMLLVGTNAWASLVTEGDKTGSEEARVIKDGGSTWMYATTLKEAFDYVEAGETATIELLKSVELTDAITMPKSISASILSGTCQTITLDLNGKDIAGADGKSVFRLVKGTLNITGSGTISKATATGNDWNGKTLITVWGGDSTAVNWSNLTIGKDVTLSITPGVKSGTGIHLQDHDQVDAAIPNTDPLYSAYSDLMTKYGYRTYYYPGDEFLSTAGVMENGICGPNGSQSSKLPLHCGAPANSSKRIQQGCAYGVNVTIYGTVKAGESGLKITGHINQTPQCASPAYHYPHFVIASGALIAASSVGGSKGIYASGYGIWDISGEVRGATGVYLKAGDVNATDAYIWSNSSSNASSMGGASGVGSAGGSAIVTESNDNYAGAMDVTISGDTKVQGGGGVAIFDETYKNDGSSTTTAIDIQGGTIEGGSAGAIAVTGETAGKTTIYGGSLTGETYVDGGETPPTTFQGEDTHVTTVTVDGKTTIVVSEGAAPTPKTTWADVVAASSQANPQNVKWEEVNVPATIGDGSTATTIYLGELQIISGKAHDEAQHPGAIDTLQQLTISNKATLFVNRLILNDYARIIVEAGGKLIVTGSQGINAPVPENILLKSTATSQATFVISHEVSSNKQPNGTVQFTTSARQTGANTYQWQRFTTPMTITATPDKIAKPSDAADYWTDGVLKTYANYLDDATESWVVISSWNQIKAFGASAITNNVKAEYTGDVTYEFKGKLMGNVTDSIRLKNTKWNYFGNSFMAPMGTSELLTSISSNQASDVDRVIYLWNFENQTYVDINSLKLSLEGSVGVDSIPAMGFFIVKNKTNSIDKFKIDYENTVYNYNVGGAAPAPARIMGSVTAIRVDIQSENGLKDQVYLVEGNDFSSDYDNSADAEKLMNKNMNIYAVDENMNYSMLATDNLIGTMLSLQTTEDINYTLTFSNVRGETYALRDNMTNAVVLMSEGATYNFSAQPNATLEGRFQIVSRQEMPTAVETIEENVNAPKAIYTIMGQYVGETTDWNNLPAGVYVVDGVKVIK